MDIDVVKIDGETDGLFVARVEGEISDSKLTYKKVGEALVVCDHTIVTEEMREAQVGVKLLEAAIADARMVGYRIVPLCPYVWHQCSKNPAWQDVFVVA